MSENKKFSLTALPPIEPQQNLDFAVSDTLEMIFSDLVGNDPDHPIRWVGTGFNNIWRPFHNPSNSGDDHFLELDITLETLQFFDNVGGVPNRGLLQPDIQFPGITYLQQISDANVKGPDGKPAGLHVEPGIWLAVPSTSNPQEPATVVRMGSIPHGTTILAQGTSETIDGAPTIPNNNITPFLIGQPDKLITFPTSNLSIPAPDRRSSGEQLNGITQEMVDNPNLVLQQALYGQVIKSTVIFNVSTIATSPIVGGGAANIAFLLGTKDGPNADVANVSFTLWIETVQGENGQADFLQLQYTQVVMLNFNTLSWPHVTVGTLRSVPA